jgi:hypothetical protein
MQSVIQKRLCQCLRSLSLTLLSPHTILQLSVRTFHCLLVSMIGIMVLLLPLSANTFSITCLIVSMGSCGRFMANLLRALRTLKYRTSVLCFGGCRSGRRSNEPGSRLSLSRCRLDATQAGTAKCGVQAMSVDERDRRRHHRRPPPAL